MDLEGADQSRFDPDGDMKVQAGGPDHHVDEAPSVPTKRPISPLPGCQSENLWRLHTGREFPDGRFLSGPAEQLGNCSGLLDLSRRVG
jgi:hypothetical protein